MAATTVLENHCDNAFAPAHRFAPSRAKTVRRRSTPAGKPSTAAALLIGDANVKRDLLPSMAAEDFAWFLEKKPDAHIWIGRQ